MLLYLKSTARFYFKVSKSGALKRREDITLLTKLKLNYKEANLIPNFTLHFKRQTQSSIKKTIYLLAANKSKDYILVNSSNIDK